MAMIKEYYENQIDMRGPGDWQAKPQVTGTVCILRFDSLQTLSLKQAASLFAEAAKDFPAVTADKVAFTANRLQISTRPTPTYKRLPPHMIGARG